MQERPLLLLTRTAGAALSANRFHTFAGAYPAAGAAAFGVTDVDAAIGDAFASKVIGTAKITSGGAFAAGDDLKSDASGKAVVQGGTGVILATALQAATGADQIVEVLLKLA